MSTAEQLSLIRLKVNALLKKISEQEKALQASEAELKLVQQELEAWRKKALDAEEKNKITKLAIGLQQMELDKTDLKKNLDRHIREIDVCLKLLTQLSDNN